MRYTVKRFAEQFDCSQCGAPVDVGDSAYQEGPEGRPFCSKRCCEARKAFSRLYEKVIGFPRRAHDDP